MFLKSYAFRTFCGAYNDAVHKWILRDHYEFYSASTHNKQHMKDILLRKAAKQEKLEKILTKTRELPTLVALSDHFFFHYNHSYGELDEGA